MKEQTKFKIEIYLHSSSITGKLCEITLNKVIGEVYWNILEALNNQLRKYDYFYDAFENLPLETWYIVDVITKYDKDSNDYVFEFENIIINRNIVYNINPEKIDKIYEIIIKLEEAMKQMKKYGDIRG